VDFDERLSVPWWWWPAAIGLVGLLGAEVYAGFGWLGAVITYVVLGGLVSLALLRMGRARVRVAGGRFEIGGRALALDEVAAVRALDAEARRVRMGPGADTRAILVTRPWISTAIELTRNNADDGVPYWLVSTRRPEDLASVVRQASGAPVGREPRRVDEA
jgi:hypothetical protein